MRTPGPARPSSEYFIEQLPARFFTLQGELRQRLHRGDGLDLARVKVASPFVRTLKLWGRAFNFSRRTNAGICGKPGRCGIAIPFLRPELGNQIRS
ncbi:MAG: hypothetical protein DMG57_37225 [Acidobacteria bacterium]|nr:MAG: hypothetical protein DMG57_37225 [Acidobacteriota bacterium]